MNTPHWMDRHPHHDPHPDRQPWPYATPDPTATNPPAAEPPPDTQLQGRHGDAAHGAHGGHWLMMLAMPGGHDQK